MEQANQEVYNLLIKGFDLYNRNRYEEAGRCFIKALEFESNNLYTLLMLAVILFKTGDYDNVKKILSFVDEFFPKYGLSINLSRLVNGSVINVKDKCLYKGFFDSTFVIDLYKTYYHELKALPVFYDYDLHNKSVTSHVEVDFLYFAIRYFKPSHVVEFSPYHGLSTTFLYEALKANNKNFTFATFDLEEFEGFTERMKRYNLPLKVIPGDAINTVPSYLQQSGLIGKIDFCFVDSEHSYEFASSYCKNIFPLLSKDCIIMFHDICYCPFRITEPFTHYGPVHPREIVGHIFSYGEGRYLSEYFSEKKNYKLFLLHKLFGGFGLFSPKLPTNREFIERLTQEISGFAYKKQDVPNYEDRKIPTMMIALPEHLLLNLDRIHELP